MPDRFSAHAIGDAYRFIKYGDADVMVCGGSEGSIHEPALAGFARMNALSTRWASEAWRRKTPYMLETAIPRSDVDAVTGKRDLVTGYLFISFVLSKRGVDYSSICLLWTFGGFSDGMQAALLPSPPAVPLTRRFVLTTCPLRRQCCVLHFARQLQRRTGEGIPAVR